MWVDTHCHPFSKPYSRDRDEVITRAINAGVSKMIAVGYNQEANRQVIELSKKYDSIYFVLGVHPTDCEDLTDEEINWIRENAGNPKLLGIGEMGLDYHHMSSSEEEQIECFRKQVKLANDLNLPCIVHSRDAAEDTLRILLEEKAKAAIFHCFTYDLEFARRVWDAGYYTSFSGVVTYPQAVGVQEAAREAPMDKFLLETDCPYLPPQSIRGRRNEMTYVIEVGEKVAELKELDIDLVKNASTKNAFKIFPKLS